LHPPIGYLWLRSPSKSLEAAAGPFWEPKRPFPPVAREEAQVRISNVESRLSDLVLARRRTLGLVLVISAAVAVLGGLAVRVFPAAGDIIIAITLALCVVPVAAWLRAWMYFWPIFGATAFVPMSGAPNSRTLAISLRGVADVFYSMPSEQAAALYRQMQRDAPLAYRVAKHMTFVPTAAKRHETVHSPT
jgi:hypothetical protein